MVYPFVVEREHKYNRRSANKFSAKWQRLRLEGGQLKEGPVHPFIRDKIGFLKDTL